MSICIKLALSKKSLNLDVDIDIKDSLVSAILGESGSGKTTLLRVVAGIERVDDATLYVDAQCWQDDKTFLAPHRRPVGYVFQDSMLFEHLSVGQNIEYALKRVGTAKRYIDIDEMLQILKIDHLLQRRPHTLSGGEKQRVAIARALATNPQILLLDEPLSALNVELKDQTLNYLSYICNTFGIQMLYVTHSFREAAAIAEQVLYLQNGRVNLAKDLNALSIDLSKVKAQEHFSIIPTKLKSELREHGLCELEFDGGIFTVDNHLAHNRVNLLIRAEDVSISLEHPLHTSVLNIFKVVVIKIESNGSRALIQLQINKTILLSSITTLSLQRLSLREDMEVFIEIKALSIST